MKEGITIAIDFDGTVVTHEFPDEGKDIGAIPILKRLVESGHKLILYTMRSGAYLESAVQWFLRNDIKLWGIQYNLDQVKWTSSNKCYAQLYIDDAALGAPLKRDTEISERPFMDWQAIEVILEMDGILPTSKDFIGGFIDAMHEDMKDAGQQKEIDRLNG